MNTFQRTAYAEPCFEAEETANQKFRHIEKRGRLFLSVVLTANIGLE